MGADSHLEGRSGTMIPLEIEDLNWIPEFLSEEEAWEIIEEQDANGELI